MDNRISRRQLLIGLLATIATAGLSGLRQLLGVANAGTVATKSVYLPFIGREDVSPAVTTRTPTPTNTPTASTQFGPKVIHVHSLRATNWDYATGWYGDYVSQSVVDTMMDQGVMSLTGKTTLADAWHAILPAYVAGQKVAIKINLNNSVCASTLNAIDALPQPVNAVIRGLKVIGVPENCICIYDVTFGSHSGEMPARVVNKIKALYPGVEFHSNTAGCSIALGYSTTEKIHFNVPPGGKATTDRPIANVLVNATYLINMPIMKMHGYGVSLAFKNHFGSFEHCDYLHWSLDRGSQYYVSTYSALIDVYKNSHIKNKTVLTIGDALYGMHCPTVNDTPTRWQSFGSRSPNSLFFSTDPVAIDSVMFDFINAESTYGPGYDNYLKLAAAANLGTFERGNPWGAGYSIIDYRKLEV